MIGYKNPFVRSHPESGPSFTTLFAVIRSRTLNTIKPPLLVSIAGSQEAVALGDSVNSLLLGNSAVGATIGRSGTGFTAGRSGATGVEVS